MTDVLNNKTDGIDRSMTLQDWIVILGSSFIVFLLAVICIYIVFSAGLLDDEMQVDENYRQVSQSQSTSVPICSNHSSDSFVKIKTRKNDGSPIKLKREYIKKNLTPPTQHEVEIDLEAGIKISSETKKALSQADYKSLEKYDKACFVIDKNT